MNTSKVEVLTNIADYNIVDNKFKLFETEVYLQK